MGRLKPSAAELAGLDAPLLGKRTRSAERAGPVGQGQVPSPVQLPAAAHVLQTTTTQDSPLLTSSTNVQAGSPQPSDKVSARALKAQFMKALRDLLRFNEGVYTGPAFDGSEFLSLYYRQDKCAACATLPRKETLTPGTTPGRCTHPTTGAVVPMYGKLMQVLETDVELLWAFDMFDKYTTGGGTDYADFMKKVKKTGAWVPIGADEVPAHALSHLA